MATNLASPENLEVVTSEAPRFLLDATWPHPNILDIPILTPTMRIIYPELVNSHALVKCGLAPTTLLAAHELK